ncbi:hypothetical protein FOL47_005423 [Perkinsus chesapeaki]|uniref:K Homology domain-containing protein n=1 Tax=Perkinsus chesapeaki TaxID=330153 RepID=A0A7J6MZ11_PERCH|nr:hypothetical protein FOL47_005423 [Perkinsus chesapeaki]
MSSSSPPSPTSAVHHHPPPQQSRPSHMSGVASPSTTTAGDGNHSNFQASAGPAGGGGMMGAQQRGGQQAGVWATGGGGGGFSNEVTKEMRIPQKAVGKAIGRGGETIKRLRYELTAFVQVDQSTCDQGFSTFKITASSEDTVDAAISYLNGVVLSCEPCQCLYPNDVEDEVEVPVDKVGTVIGPQGCVLDEIRRRTGCRVQLQPVAVEDGSPRFAKIVGSADAVRTCVNLLNDVISGTFDVGPIIQRQKAHHQRTQGKLSPMGGGNSNNNSGGVGRGKGKGKGVGGVGGGSAYWTMNNASGLARPQAASGGGQQQQQQQQGPMQGGGGGLGFPGPGAPAAGMGFVPQVMYSPQQMFAAASAAGMLSPHMAATGPSPALTGGGQPIPPYLISMYGGYQQQQQQQPLQQQQGGGAAGGDGMSKNTRQQQQQQQRSTPGGGQMLNSSNNVGGQYQPGPPPPQQQQSASMPMSPQGVITPQQVMAVHQILRREQLQQRQQQQQQQQQQNRGGEGNEGSSGGGTDNVTSYSS